MLTSNSAKKFGSFLGGNIFKKKTKHGPKDKDTATHTSASSSSQGNKTEPSPPRSQCSAAKDPSKEDIIAEINKLMNAQLGHDTKPTNTNNNYCDDSTVHTNLITSIHPKDFDEDLVSVLPGGAATFAPNSTSTQQLEAPGDGHSAAREVEQPNIATTTVPIDRDTCAPTLLQNMKMVEEFWTCMNAHNLAGLRNVCTEDYEVVFMGADRQINMTLDLDGVTEEVQKMFDAFLDFKFMMRTPEESAVQEGVIVVHDFVATGTHTGKPFGIGPCEPIKGTGKFVLLDAEEHHYYFRDGKVCKEEVVPMGEMTGPMGIYIQIGGFPIM